MGLLRFGGDVVIALTRDQGASDHHGGAGSSDVFFFFRVHYMHFSALSFLASTAAMWFASLVTAPPLDSTLESTTFYWGIADDVLREQLDQAKVAATKGGVEGRARLEAEGRICCFGLEDARRWL